MSTATETNSVPKGWVMLAAIGLIVAAIAGTYLGVERSLGAHDLPSDTDTLSAVPNVTNAKPLADTAADDARMRALVHEEVAAALKAAKPAAPKPAAKTDDDSSTSASDATASLNAAAAGKPTVKPSTTKPAATTTTGTTSGGAIPF
jgi:hypothetical protein